MAQIYKNGYGVTVDKEKYKKYLEIAGSISNGKANSALASNAKNDGDMVKHLIYLKRAVESADRKAARELGYIYLRGEGVVPDVETAFMYFFLGCKDEFLRKKDNRHGDTRFPGERKDMFEVFKRDDVENILTIASQRTNGFVSKNKFQSFNPKCMRRSYRIAQGDLNYIRKTGGHWYRSATWAYFFVGLMLFLYVGCIGFVMKRVSD